MTEVRRFGFCDKALGNVENPNTTSLDISHDSTNLAVGGEGAFGVWRLTTGEQLLAVADANESFEVKFHPSEAKLYVVTSNSIQVWIPDGEQFVKQSTTPVRLKKGDFVFAEDAAVLGVLEKKKSRLTLYRLPDQQP